MAWYVCGGVTVGLIGGDIVIGVGFRLDCLFLKEC